MKKLFSILMITVLILVSSFAFSKTIEVRVVNTSEVFVSGAFVKVYFENEEPVTDYNFPGWAFYIIEDNDYVTQITFVAPAGYFYYNEYNAGDVYTFVVTN